MSVEDVRVLLENKTAPVIGVAPGAVKRRSEAQAATSVAVAAGAS